jgi:hypothetical protein
MNERHEQYMKRRFREEQELKQVQQDESIQTVLAKLETIEQKLDTFIKQSAYDIYKGV